MARLIFALNENFEPVSPCSEMRNSKNWCTKKNLLQGLKKDSVGLIGAQLFSELD